MWPFATYYYRGPWQYQAWLDAYRRMPLPHPISVVTAPPVEEPLTLAEAKLRAGFVWNPGDEREALLLDFISAARAHVEDETGLALIAQTKEIYFDAVMGPILVLPPGSMPLTAVVSIETTSQDGVVTVMDPATYLVDYASGRISLPTGGYWPANLRWFQPWKITIQCGYPSAAALALQVPALRQAVGLLTAHYATLGRDLASTAPATCIPNNYDELIQPYRMVTVP
jgi:uncharacterized phiE125 gp8 family phage protein